MTAPITTDLIELADAVATDFAALTFNQTVAVEREWDPTIDIASLDTCVLTVVAKGESSARASRVALQVTSLIGVAVRKKLDATRTKSQRKADIDALTAILNQAAYYHFNATPTDRAEKWDGVQMTFVFDPNEADQLDTYVGVCEVTFSGLRTPPIKGAA